MWQSVRLYPRKPKALCRQLPACEAFLPARRSLQLMWASPGSCTPQISNSRSVTTSPPSGTGLIHPGSYCHQISQGMVIMPALCWLPRTKYLIQPPACHKVSQSQFLGKIGRISCSKGSDPIQSPKLQVPYCSAASPKTAFTCGYFRWWVGILKIACGDTGATNFTCTWPFYIGTRGNVERNIK